MPQGWSRLMRIPGLGPKKIKVLYDELKIDSLADLRAAGESGKIAMMKGFGEKTQANILAGISFVEKSSERILQSTARRLVAPIVEQLKSHRDVIRIEVCGSLRRRAETIGDLDVLISSENVPAVLDAFVKLPQVADGAGATGRPRRACNLPTAFSAICGGSRTRSFRSRCITSRARRPTTSRCGSGRSPGGFR